jgi:hypothetical protein
MLFFVFLELWLFKFPVFLEMSLFSFSLILGKIVKMQVF